MLILHPKTVFLGAAEAKECQLRLWALKAIP